MAQQRKTKLEKDFEDDLVAELKDMFPGIDIVKRNGDPQGIPDLLLLWRGQYAYLEDKREHNSARQANQQWYVDYENENGGFAAFVHPENKDEVLRELQAAFRSGEQARYAKR